MKRVLALLLALLMAVGMASCTKTTTDPGETGQSGTAEQTLQPTEPADPGQNEQKDIMILFTSDIHCGIDEGFTLVGLKAIKEQLAKKYHVILADNGDAVNGTALGAITKGEAIIRLMNAVGYDVATPGNHSFDFGMDRMLELTQKTAEYPYVSANFTHSGELVFRPYVIREAGGVKIAFVGISTPDTFVSANPTCFMDKDRNIVYGFGEDATGEVLYTAVQKAVNDARAEGAQYVIALAHLGLEQSCKPWRSIDVAANTTGIDVMLDGHSHSVYSQQDEITMDDGTVLTAERMKNKNGEPVAMAGCGTQMQAIGYCRIGTDGSISTGLYRWDNKENAAELLGLENDMTDAIAQQTDGLNKTLNQVVAHTDVDLIIHDPATGERVIRKRETNLGDLVTDAYRKTTGSDIALTNSGGIRTTLPAGDLTLNDLCACHPFGNSLCMVETTGQHILDALEWASRDLPSENGGFLQVSGLTYEIHTYIESSAISDIYGSFVGVAGEYRVKNVKVNGEPLDVNKTYTVAALDFLLKSGGDGTNCFVNDRLLLDGIKLDYQTLIDYITEDLGGSVGEEYADIWGQGRIVIVPEAK